MKTDSIAFIDIEGYTDSKEHRFGILFRNIQYKSSSASKIRNILEDNQYSYICGHNFFKHDLIISEKYSLTQQIKEEKIIDTLYLSMLLYPGKRSHRLTKPYKTEIFIDNEPAADCEQTRELLLIFDEKFHSLPDLLKKSFYSLLYQNKFYQAYFKWIDYKTDNNLAYLTLLKEFSYLEDKELLNLAKHHPIEMALLCSILYSHDRKVFSQIIFHQFPDITWIREYVLFNKNNTDQYIDTFSINEFGFSSFREFPAVNDTLFTISQEDIVKSAVQGRSLLAVLPTGGGKTFTFQLPALIKASVNKSLTVVISPLQALMRDQILNFNSNIQNYKAAAISGYLNPIARINALEEIRNGSIDILYITPESLRSNTVFRALQHRLIERFVIDEAHCFSAWGHDFRHDYFYIGQFIKELQSSDYQKPIPVSCFTATARPNVLYDIKKYFKDILNIELESYIASSERTNLFYHAVSFKSESEKYEHLIEILQKESNKPIIIYRPQNAKGCASLVDRLRNDERLFNYDLVIEPFYANIDDDRKEHRDTTRSKSQILEDFINNEVNIVVATTAFGMGIDKPDIRLVIHYDPSDSLESYMQESGRGGRSPDINADCFVLYTNNDFSRIFRNLSINKVEYSEVYEVAKILRKQKRNPFYITTRSIAEKVGIDTENTAKDYDSLIKTAVLELEKWDVIKRGRNYTKIYATSLPHDWDNADKLPMEIVHEILDPQKRFYGENYQLMILLMQNIIQRSKEHAIEIDELSDIIGAEKKIIFKVVADLQKEELLEYKNDISILIGKNILKDLDKVFKLEKEIFRLVKENSKNHSFDLRTYKNEDKLKNILKTDFQIVKNWKALASIHNYNIKLVFKKFGISFDLSSDDFRLIEKWIKTRQEVCRYVANCCVEELTRKNIDSGEIEICSNQIFHNLIEKTKVSIEFYHHSMVFLDELLEGFKLNKGKLIYYNAMSFEKGPKLDRPTPYQRREYKESLGLHYEKKIESVHFLIYFLKNLEKNGWNSQKKYIRDYFSLTYKDFIKQYGFNVEKIKHPITEEDLQKIESGLNEEQKEIIKDLDSRAILVLAGPGSGKTKTLVHKIASMITKENNKPDYFLMLTHSRVAMKEFKERLMELIGSTAGIVDIYTFHAYAASIVGELLDSESAMDKIIPKATALLKNRVYTLPFKTMLVLDEFQDISQQMYDFISVIFKNMGKDKRIIAVGDDDQCINNFSSNKANIALMGKFIEDYSYNKTDSEINTVTIPVKIYNLLKNYRSRENLINFTNKYVKSLHNRQKKDDLVPVKVENGLLTLHRYIHGQPGSKTYLTNLAEDAATNPSKDIAVLLRSNEEVLTVYSLLKINGINVQYISERQGFRLGHLVELQDFLMEWRDNRDINVAKKYLSLNYEKSSNYSLANKVIDYFLKDKDLVQLSQAPITFSDRFDEYLEQISKDEFLENETKVTVSTMHKSKGREFDTVYLGIIPGIDRDEYSKRLLYVAMTRAKNNLHIHTACRVFEPYLNFFTKVEDIQDTFQLPKLISFSMNLRDLWLGNTHSINNIEATKPLAGETVKIRKKHYSSGIGFAIVKDNAEIALLSKPSNDKRISSKILKHEEMGYTLIEDCIIEDIVYWSDPNVQNQIKFKEVLCRIQMILDNEKFK